jgi:PAS domain S-box-containing protein
MALGTHVRPWIASPHVARTRPLPLPNTAESSGQGSGGASGGGGSGPGGGSGGGNSGGGAGGGSGASGGGGGGGGGGSGGGGRHGGGGGGRNGEAAIPWRVLAREGAFRAVHELCADLNLGRLLLFVLWLLDALQMFALALLPHPDLPWARMPLVRSGIYTVLLPFALTPAQHRPGLGVGVPISWLTWYLIVAGVCALTLSSLTWIAYSYSAVDAPHAPGWVKAVTRLTLLCLIHGFAVPVISTLISPFVCGADGGPDYFGSGLVCWGAAHDGLVVTSAILVVPTIGGLIALSTLLVDRTPDASGKKHILCAPHGRVTAAMLVVKTLVSLLSLFPGGINRWGYAIITMAAGIIWAGLYLRFLPYWHVGLNAIQVSAAFVYTAAGACLALAAGLDDQSGGRASSSSSSSSSSTIDPSDPTAASTGAFAWLAVLPMAAFLGWSVTCIRFRRFAHAHPGEFLSAYTVEIRARSILQEAVAWHGLHLGSPDGWGEDAEAKAAKAEIAAEIAAAAAAASAAALADGPGGLGGGGGGLGGGGGGYGHSRGQGPVRRLGRLGDAAAAAAAAGASPSKPGDYVAADIVDTTHPVLLEVDRLYLDAIRSPGLGDTSAVLRLFYSHYLGTMRNNAHLERLQLKQALVLADSMAIDVHFAIWSRRLFMTLKEQSTGKTRMNVERRVRCENLLAQSREQVVETRALLLSFWSGLGEKVPDLGTMQAVGTNVNVSIRTTTATFEELLALAPQNASVMRQFAEFLLDLANDRKRASELLADAEQIEDEQSRALELNKDTDILFGAAAPDFDLSAETVGFIRISNDLHTLGIVLQCNAAIQNMFGYARRELLGRSLDILIPEPLCRVHNLILAQHLDDGKERVMGVSRTIFGLHRAGHIFPMRINIHASGQDFSAVVEEIFSSASYILFLDDGGKHPDGGYPVAAACLNSLAMLGVEASAIKGGTVSMSRYFADTEATIRQIRSSDSAAVFFVNVADGFTGSSTDDEGGTLLPATVAIQRVIMPFFATPLFVLRWRSRKPTKASLAADTRARAAALAAMHKTAAAVAAGGNVAAGDGGTGRPAATGSGSGSGRVPAADTSDARSTSSVSSRSHLGPEISLCPFGGGRKAGGQDGDHGARLPPGHPSVPSSAEPASSSSAGAGASTEGEGGGSVQRATNPIVRRRSEQSSSTPGPASAALGLSLGQPKSASRASSASSSAVGGGRRGVEGGTGKAAPAPSAGRRVTLSPPEDHHNSIADTPSEDEASTMPAPAASSSSSKVPKSASSSLAPSAPLPGAVPSPRPSGTNDRVDGSSDNDRPATTWAASESLVHANTSDTTPGAGTGVGAGAGPGPGGHTRSFSQARRADSGRSGRGGGGGEGSAFPFTSPAQERAGSSADLLRAGTPSSSSTSTSHPRSTTDGPRGRADTTAGASAMRLDSTSSDDLEGSGGGWEGTRGGRGGRKQGGGPTSSSSFRGRGGGGPGSVHSKGSNASFSSSEVLRRGVTARGSYLETSLVTLKRSVLVVFLVTAGLSIIGLGMTVSLTSQLIANIELVELNGRRGVLLQRIVSNVADTVYASGERKLLLGGDPPLFSNVTLVGEATRPILREFLDHHRTLYLALDTSSTDEVAMYTVPWVPVTELVPGTYADRVTHANTTRLVGLTNAGIEFHERASRAFLSIAPQAFLPNHTDVFYLLENGPNSIRNAMNSSMMHANLRSATQAETMQYADLVILAVSEGVALIISLVVMAPAILSVVMAKTRVFHIIIQVPLPIVRALRAKVQRKILAQARAMDEAENVLQISDTRAEVLLEDEERDPSMAAMLASSLSGAARSVGLGAHLGPLDSRSNDGDNDDSDEEDAGLLAAINAYSNVLKASGANTEDGDGITGGAGRPWFGFGRGEAATATAAPASSSATSALPPGAAYPATTSSSAAAASSSTPAAGGADGGKGAGGDVSSSSSWWGMWRGGAHPAHPAHPAGAPAGLRRRPVRGRQYRRVQSSAFRTLLSLLWPIAAYMGLFGSVFAYKRGLLEDSKWMRSEVLWSRQTEFYLRQVNFRLRAGLAYCEEPYASASLSLAAAAIDFEEALVDEVLYGSPEAARRMRPGLLVSPTYRSLFLENGCVQNDGIFYALDDCTRFYSGLVAKGLLAGFKTYAGLVRKLVTARRAVLAGGPGACRPASLDDPEIADTNALAAAYLAAGFHEAADDRETEAAQMLRGFVSTSITITIVSCLALVGFWFIVYRPEIQLLDKEIKDVRCVGGRGGGGVGVGWGGGVFPARVSSFPGHKPFPSRRLLLLLFPEEVSKAIPALVNAGKELLTESAGKAT